MSTLKQSKVTSGEISNRLKLAEENERRISLARSRYLPVATRGAVLHFVLADLENLNPMYQFSLNWFINMFEQCIGVFDLTLSRDSTSEILSRDDEYMTLFVASDKAEMNCTTAMVGSGQSSKQCY